MKIIKAGPIIKTRMTLPFRVVLKQNEKEFVAHLQVFDIENNLVSFCYGDYTNDAARADYFFQEKCKKYYDNLTVDCFLHQDCFKAIELSLK